MSEPVLSSINSLFQVDGAQKTNGIEAFDLDDDRFSNILDGELDKLQDDDIKQNNLVGQLGVPAGLNIEGFDYNSFIDNLDPSDMVDGIDTDSNIKDNNKFDLGSLVDDAKEAFSPVVDSLMNGKLNLESGNSANPVQAVKNFWGNQASNFYSLMDKDTVNDISDLVAKL